MWLPSTLWGHRPPVPKGSERGGTCLGAPTRGGWGWPWAARPLSLRKGAGNEVPETDAASAPRVCFLRREMASARSGCPRWRTLQSRNSLAWAAAARPPVGTGGVVNSFIHTPQSLQQMTMRGTEGTSHMCRFCLRDQTSRARTHPQHNPGGASGTPPVRPGGKGKVWGLRHICASHPNPLLPISCVLPSVRPVWLLGDQPHELEVLTLPSPCYTFIGGAGARQLRYKVPSGKRKSEKHRGQCCQ